MSQVFWFASDEELFQCHNLKVRLSSGPGEFYGVQCEPSPCTHTSSSGRAVRLSPCNAGTRHNINNALASDTTDITNRASNSKNS